jgi:hypothetical protein
MHKAEPYATLIGAMPVTILVYLTGERPLVQPKPRRSSAQDERSPQKLRVRVRHHRERRAP